VSEKSKREISTNQFCASILVCEKEVIQEIDIRFFFTLQNTQDA
jgi:hypothetical protein